MHSLLTGRVGLLGVCECLAWKMGDGLGRPTPPKHRTLEDAVFATDFGLTPANHRVLSLSWSRVGWVGGWVAECQAQERTDLPSC